MNFKNANILIVGDVMLDQYWFGSTSRISPEAPVPVVNVNHMNERPGGAANVALGVKALSANPRLLGVVGMDSMAKRLEEMLVEAAVSYHLLPLKGSNTITKLRVLCRNQQMIRLDSEQPFVPASNPVFNEKLRETFLTALATTEVVVLSDYGKGILTDAAWFITESRKKNIPVIIDPKSLDFSIYSGASIVTPNMREFEAIVGPCDSEEMIILKARELLTRFNIETLIVTRSEHGLSIVTKETAVHVPAMAREVHDVTGAGDTVVAVLACALASQIPLVQAATLSNIAAGLAVEKLGAATVSASEIQKVIESKQICGAGIMTEAALLSEVKLSKARGEKIVFTNGCFDILHAGHVLYLEQAKRLGDKVIVALNTDESVKRIKGKTRPLNKLEDRMKVLASLKFVDWVISFSEDTPERLIQSISPDVLVKGGDYKHKETLPGAAYVLSQGGTVEILGHKEGYSTTNLIDRCLEDS